MTALENHDRSSRPHLRQPDKGVSAMSKLFEDMMSSLNEIIAFEKGENADVVVHKVTIREIKAFSPAEIKSIRLNANMTQGTFAACIGVTKKAVEAWEGGRSKPDGAARRTLGLLQSNPRFADEAGIITR